MPEKRRLSLSFSLAQREQRDAWERLSAVAPGQRMDAVCRMINGYMEQQELLEAVRRIIREELAGVSFPKPLRSRSRPGPSMRTSSAFSVRCRREMRSPDTIF
mgnify:CR=1 FL=1